MGRESSSRASTICFCFVLAVVLFTSIYFITTAPSSYSNDEGDIKNTNAEPIAKPLSKPRGSAGHCLPGKVNDNDPEPSLRFDEGSCSLDFEVIRTATNPPFNLAKPIDSDPCANLPGRFAKQTGYFAPIETSIFRTLLFEKCTKVGANGKPPLVVDVGGNIGYFAAYSATMGCRVKSFEPLPRAIKYLNTTILVNNFADKVEVFHVALSDKAESSTITENCGDTGQSKIKGDLTGIPIRMDRLDKFVQEDILLLKIDTEGFEMSVLNGATNLLEKFTVHNILTEMKPTDNAEKAEFINGMIYRGYKAWNYCEHYSGTDFINGMISRGYKAWNYSEHYSGTRTAPWPDKVLKNVDRSHLIPIKEVSALKWLKCEDVLLTLTNPF